MAATNKLFVVIAATFILLLVVASIVSIMKGGVLIIPGIAPEVWAKDQEVVLYVNKVTSIHSPVPYRYNDLPVCKEGNPEQKSENLGEIIGGNRIETSVFKLHMLQDSPSPHCEIACKELVLSSEDIEKLTGLIEDEYLVQWQIDTLPAAHEAGQSASGDSVYEIGFPLGYSTEKGGDKEYFLFNHVDLIIHYNEFTEGQYHIVFFEVGTGSHVGNTCDKKGPFSLSKSSKLTWTYSVKWTPSETLWADRWQSYLVNANDGQIHWFSIVNSLMIVLFLSGLIAMILARTVRRDLMKFMEEEDKEIEEYGWKLVRSDVFRPPNFKTLFSVLVGSGVQVFCMTVITMVFAVLGFLSPSNSGSLTTAVLVLFVWMGVAAGYSSSRIYLMFDGHHRTRNTLVTAFLFPGFLFGIAFFLNFFLWYKQSSGAFPFTTILGIIALWFCISVPLCFLGSRLAYTRKEPPKHPGTVTIIPRQIPEQRWYMRPVLSVLMGGILPFGAVFIELFFIMSSIWLHKYYFLFGFLFLVFLILIITCAEISVVMCYFQLCSEDWRWWWRSYLTSATSAFYMFLYAIFYYVTKLQVDGFINTLIYFGYSLILTSFFFVLTGTIGFYACYYFVLKIYRAIHQD